MKSFKAGIIVLLIAALPAMATEKKGYRGTEINQTINSHNTRNVDKSIDVDSRSESTSFSSALATAAGGSAINDGNSLSVSSKQAGDIILVPNNNTEKCLRVIGLSFGNSDGGGGIGWPYRSQQCDLEAAADDAFAQGDRELGWMLKCKQKSMRKAFGGKSWRDDGERLCVAAAVGQVRLEDRLRELTEQHTAMLQKREAEASQCSQLVERANERTERCFEKLTEGK